MFERKGYVYRFMDENNRVLYVGMTSNMGKRMSQHFNHKNNHIRKQGKGHLYNKVQRIEYFSCPTEYDALVKELLYINLYKPRYNTASKVRQIIDAPKKADNWKVYKTIKPLTEEQEKTNERISTFAPLLPVALFIFFILILINSL